jgi:putative ABC transport system permease protein
VGSRAKYAQIRAVDPDQPVYDVRTMSAVVSRSLAQPWLMTAVLAAFAVVALVLASIGVYGVVAYGVRQRAREFGIRMALGAGQRDVLVLVMRRGVTLVGWGGRDRHDVRAPGNACSGETAAWREHD